jgi:hypothetical protein
LGTDSTHAILNRFLNYCSNPGGSRVSQYSVASDSVGFDRFFYIDSQGSKNSSAAYRNEMDEIEEEIKKSRQLITRDEININDLHWHAERSSSVEDAINTRSELKPALSAVVKNKSRLATLTSIGFFAKLYDCTNTGNDCDQIGDFSTAICADIPPGQVRLMNPTCAYGWPNTVTNMPRLKGKLRIDYSVDYIEGRKVQSSD